MRTTTLGITFILASGLLATTTLRVAAQAETDRPMASAVFGWAVVDVLDGGVLVLEADDPRASGVMTQGEPAVHQQRDIDGSSLDFGYDTVRIENEDGAWVGSRIHLALDRTADPRVHRGLDVLQLEGQGGYLGLRLRLVDEGGPDAGRLAWGVIFPADPVPEATHAAP